MSDHYSCDVCGYTSKTMNHAVIRSMTTVKYTLMNGANRIKRFGGSAGFSIDLCDDCRKLAIGLNDRQVVAMEFVKFLKRKREERINEQREN